MENISTKSSITTSLIWKFMERGGLQITQFVISLVIARILDPDDYGIVAIVTIFLSIASIFVQSGLGTALVQKKNIDEVEFSSVFFYSLLIAAITYLLLFISAPWIATFFGMPQLIMLTRIMALTLFPGALNSIQNAAVAREMQFKKQFISSMIAVLISGVVGIGLAYLNYGAWALVWQQLIYQASVCIIMWFLVKWKPSFVFSYKKTLGLLKYGTKLLTAGLIDTLYHNLENAIIGKKYSSDTLAFFSKGKQFPLIMINNIDGSIQSVMLPAFSAKQEDLSKVKELVRRTVSLSTYLVFPAMVGLAAVGYPLIQLVLGDKWVPCVPFLQMYCLTTALFPLQTANLQAINAIGRSDVYLKLMTKKRIVGVIILFIAVFCFDSVYIIALSCTVIEIISIFINIQPNKSLLDYKFSEQIRDIVPNLIISLIMGICVYYMSFINLHSFILIIVQTCSGLVIYLSLSIIFKLSNFTYLLNTAKTYIQKI